MIVAHVSRPFSILAFTWLVAACGESPVAPHALAAPPVAVAATRDHLEFSDYNDYDYPLSCVSGTTHWEGWVHVTIDVLTTPSGMISTRFNVVFDEDYFVEMPNGTRYSPVSFAVHEHHVDGKLSTIAGKASGVFRSEDGHTIPLGFHVQVVYDPQSNAVVDWKFTGACP